ncbi:MAG: hypothetical protein RL160_1808 [Bacteroidota bacterium]|jgi:hypothetical protein
MRMYFGVIAPRSGKLTPREGFKVACCILITVRFPGSHLTGAVL